MAMTPTAGPRAADLVLFNANVITVEPEKPRARAVAVAGDRILYVGADAGALALAGPGARILNLQGRTLVPGFNDDHVHTLAFGAFYLEPILWGKSCEEIAAIVAAEARKRKPGETVSGNSWDYPACPNPNRALLDRAAPANPVYLTQYSGHAAWVNSAMLKKLKIDRDTPDPKGGQIVRDAAGEPTGVLRDTAMGSQTNQFIGRLLDRDQHRRIVDQALELYRQAGITSVQDNTWEPLTARLLAGYRDQGRLTARFTCWPYGLVRTSTALMRLVPYDDLYLQRGPWKYFMDGAFSTRTGWLSEPYADEPGNVGQPRFTPEEMDKIVMAAARAHRQLAVHAIGDRAVKTVIDAVEKAAARYPWTPSLRIRIEHAQLMDPADIPRMKRLGMVAAVQPFTISTPGKDVTLLGPERARRAYPFHSLFRAGVPVAFGSDAPAEVDFQPLLAIYYAVTRMNKAGTEGPLNPDERFTAEEALYCYTMGSAYAEFMENEKGSITPGKLADFAVLSNDLTAVAPAAIKDLKVLLTVVGGRVVYAAGE
jgi:hypothetical protein